MAVQYNKDDNKWSGFLIDIYKAKKGIIEVSDEATKFFDKTKNWKNTSLIITDEAKFDSFIKKMGLADESLINFLKDTNYSKKDLASYQQYLKDTGKSTSAFTSFTQKAGTALKSFGAALGSMAINWTISKGIELVAKGFDNLAHSAEHCKERVDELMSSYSSALDKANSNAKTIENLASRYEELSKGVNNLGEVYGLTEKRWLCFGDKSLFGIEFFYYQ